MSDVLISGAGVAGPTLAFWLARNGFRATVVERAGAMRSSGSPVDVRGPALAVAERMGVVPRLREARTGAVALDFVDRAGRRRGGVAMSDSGIEIPRSDLARALYEAGRGEVEYLFGEHIVGLEQDPGGVEVTFAQGGQRRFDLVIGADGLHSGVRRLVFGEERQFSRHMGVYVATLPLGLSTSEGPRIVMYNEPGRSVTVHPSRGGGIAAFMFRRAEIPGFDYRDLAQHKQVLLETFGADGWRVPELLERVEAAEDLYFDSVSKVDMPSWSKGRVALVGDAASCVSLFGDGSTLAMSGAYTLAEELGSGVGFGAALAGYERKHRRLVEPKQRNVSRAATLLIPSSRAGIAARNLATRLIPGMKA